jgi:hypothetical protein
MLAACLYALPGQARVTQALDITNALTLYDSGRYPEFFDAIGHEGAVHRDLFKEFKKEAERWVETSDATAKQRRTFVAASFGLEIAHLLHDEPPEWPAEYLIWASLAVQNGVPPVPTPLEHLWYLAAIAGMEELDEPWVLTTGARTGNSVLDPARRDMDPGGQAAIALERFPDEPRFRLPAVQAQEAEIGLWFDRAPAFTDFVRALAQKDAPSEPRTPEERWASGERYHAGRLLREYAQVPEIVQAYQRLWVYPTLRPEIALHVGFLASVSNPTVALDLLRQVPALTDERYLRYLAHYFTGRVFQRTGNPAAAIEAFDRAVQEVPNGRAASALLAGELMMRGGDGDRDRAYALLRGTYTNAAPIDPWRLYYHGDARLRTLYSAQLREALIHKQ